MSETVITLDEVISELNKGRKGATPGFTSEELADKLNCSVELARKKLRSLFLGGKLTQAGTRTATTMSGKTFHVPVYALTQKSKKKIKN